MYFCELNIVMRNNKKMYNRFCSCVNSCYIFCYIFLRYGNVYTDNKLYFVVA